MWETWVWSLGWEDTLQKGKATHSSILAWRIPWREEPGGLLSMGSQRVRHDWASMCACARTHTYTHKGWKVTLCCFLLISRKEISFLKYLLLKLVGFMCFDSFFYSSGSSTTTSFVFYPLLLHICICKNMCLEWERWSSVLSSGTSLD